MREAQEGPCYQMTLLGVHEPDEIVTPHLLPSVPHHQMTLLGVHENYLWVGLSQEPREECLTLLTHMLRDAVLAERRDGVRQLAATEPRKGELR
jgi:hypothetical protein